MIEVLEHVSSDHSLWQVECYCWNLNVTSTLRAEDSKINKSELKAKIRERKNGLLRSERFFSKLSTLLVTDLWFDPLPFEFFFIRKAISYVKSNIHILYSSNWISKCWNPASKRASINLLMNLRAKKFRATLKKI